MRISIQADSTEALRSGPPPAVPPPLPVRSVAAADAARAFPGLRQLVEVLDVDLQVGAAFVTAADNPAAVAQCADICELAVAVRRPPCVYHLDDVLAEYQLTGPGPALHLLLETTQPARP
ncbi:hypothetical protein ACIRD6_00590 [Streptomyces sp. NPDC102473]|uniref:hypothetical protein n=1 Tax=Streptomyces sp. NPDC102473 TaxID=3366180 RepID=UPI00382AFF6E